MQKERQVRRISPEKVLAKNACISQQTGYLLIVNSKHRKTLKALFATPTRTNIEFCDIEKLFIALGGTAVEGRGSRVRFAFGERIISFHRPHPQREARPYQVEAAREFLERMGLKT